MAQGYFTLEEAAQHLGMPADELSQMAQRREIRAFADRGTWRFRTQDVEELAQKRGGAPAAAPDLDLGGPDLDLDVGGPDLGADLDMDEPAAAAPDLGAPLDLGGDLDLDEPAPVKKRTSNLDAKAKNPKKTSMADGDDELFEFELSMDGGDAQDLEADSSINVVAPPPTDASPKRDSAVKMVFDDNDDFDLADQPRKTGLPSPAKAKTKLPADSAEQLVPFDDEPTVGLSDDDHGDGPVNLADNLEPSPVAPELPQTQEFQIDDFDAELREAEEATRRPKTKAPELPTSSPFELSESDLDDDMPPPPPKKTTSGLRKTKVFKDPAPASEDEDEVSLGDLSPESDFAGSSGSSGINLHLPADTGVNLEKAGDEVEFELSLDADGPPPSIKQSDLDAGGGGGSESSSEFELTLDDTGGLASLEDESPSTEAAEGEEKDIFETDFDIPALEEEGSGSEVVAVDEADTDLESSDFDFDAAGGGGGGEDSGSQVVALDEEVDDSDAGHPSKSDDEEETEEEVDELAEDDDSAPPSRAPAPAAAPANWGALPAIFMLPCVVVMFLLSLMTFEMLHGMWGYKQTYKPTGVLVKPISELFGAELPND